MITFPLCDCGVARITSDSDDKALVVFPLGPIEAKEVNSTVAAKTNIKNLLFTFGYFY
jgi:hypothetical protein